MENMVSVVIPAYNCGRFILESIRSVAAQSYRNTEIIVVDDGSKDDTAAVLRPLREQGTIRYFYQENRGPAAARNRGIRAAQGAFIAFLDADDLWDREKLRKSVDFLVSRGFDWMCTAMLKVRRDGNTLVKRIPDDSWVLNRQTGEIRQLKRGIFYFSSVPVHTPTIMASAACFRTAGYFDEAFLVGEDTDLWLRFEESGLRGGYLDEPLTVYRYNDGSITRGRTVDGLAEHLKVARKHARILGMDRPMIRRSYARFLWQTADIYYANGSYLRALKCILLSLRQDHAHFLRLMRKLTTGDHTAVDANRTGVLYYDPTSGFGGASRCLVAWLEKLDRTAYRPVVVTQYSGPMFQKMREMGVKVIQMPLTPIYPYNPHKMRRYPKAVSYATALLHFLFFELPAAVYIYAVIGSERIDVIHLNAKVISVIPGIIAAKLSHTPSVCHLHDTTMPIRRERLFAQWVDRLVALTGKAREHYLRAYPHKRIELITNGINLALYPGERSAGTAARRELGIPEDDRVVGIVGRLVKGKGFADFIEAAGMVLEHAKNVTFVIVGSDPAEGKSFEGFLHRQVKALGIGDKVVFTGWREDALRIMAAFDILVQASSTFPEGFGLTVAEGMALRKPVIVTDIPGPSEINVDGVTGYTVPPANPVKLAAAMRRLLEDPDLAAMMGENGRLRVENHFNLDMTIRKIEGSYRSLLEAGYGTRPSGLITTPPAKH